MNWSQIIIRILLIACLTLSSVYIFVYRRIGEGVYFKKHKINVPNTIQSPMNKIIIDSVDKQGKGTDQPLNEFNFTKNISLLTLFTTWRDSKEKEIVIRNTIENWETFHPYSSTVVFANSLTSSHHFATEHGWTILKSKTATDENIPLLKDMFIQAMRHKESVFYCYANSDILFTPSLLKTLMKIKSFKQDKDEQLLIVGQRKDFSVVNVPFSNNFSYVLRRALHEGATHAPDAIDYLIVSKDFPIYDLPDVVIGRIAYDNYVIMHARAHRVVVIDATQTNPAIHQTTQAGNMEGHHHRNKLYNRELLKKVLQIDTYESGLTTCSNYVTKFNSSTHEVNLLRKKSKPEYCVRMFKSW